MLSRKQKENAIAKRISSSDKKGRGVNRVIMLTGNLAKSLDLPSYTTMKMIDFTDSQIDTLYQTLYGKVASSKEEDQILRELNQVIDLSYVEKKESYTAAKFFGDVFLVKSRMSQVSRLFWVVASETRGSSTEYHPIHATLNRRDALDMFDTVLSNYERN